MAFRTSGTLTITPALQTITFTTRAVHPTYGGSYAVAATSNGGSGNPVTFSIDPAGGVGVCTISGATVSFTSAGECIVDAAQAGAMDYQAAAIRQQTLVVAKAKLTVTADPQSRAAGTPNPSLTATIAGFVNGQTLASSGLSGAPRCTTTAVLTSAPGDYPISCTHASLAALPNTYAFTFVAGQLTVTDG
jgi:hypothetical protein